MGNVILFLTTALDKTQIPIKASNCGRITVEFWEDIMYAKPDEEMMGKVKDEKQYRAATRAVLKVN